MFSWLFSPLRWVLPQALPPPPKPSPFLDKPWRTYKKEKGKTDEQYNKDLMEEIKSAQLKGVEAAELLLIGPQQSGKSSFVNSIISIVKGRKAHKTQALHADKTVTNRLLKISGQGDLCKLRLKDTVGIIEADSPDVTCDYIEAILSGDVKHREKLSQRVRSSQTTMPAQGPSKQTAHCVIFVVDANVVKWDKDIKGQDKESYNTKVKRLMDKVKDMGIPFILVLTKIDMLCEEVENDISVAFKSVAVKEVVDVAKRIFGFQEIDIYPVKNYEKETTMDPYMDMLFLQAIRHAINYSVDYLEDLEEN